MKTIPSSARLPALLACASALLLTGCVSKPAATLIVQQEKVVTKNFKWVYVTGSHIPIRVPTNPDVRTVPGISPIVVITAEDATNRGFFPMH